MTRAEILERRLASVQKAGDYLDVHPMTIRRYIARGVITGYRVGKRDIRVDLNEIDAKLLHTVPATGGAA